MYFEGCKDMGDTIATITGGLAALAYEYENISKKWRNVLTLLINKVWKYKL